MDDNTSRIPAGAPDVSRSIVGHDPLGIWTAVCIVPHRPDGHVDRHGTPSVWKPLSLTDDSGPFPRVGADEQRAVLGDPSRVVLVPNSVLSLDGRWSCPLGRPEDVATVALACGLVPEDTLALVFYGNDEVADRLLRLGCPALPGFRHAGNSIEVKPPMAVPSDEAAQMASGIACWAAKEALALVVSTVGDVDEDETTFPTKNAAGWLRAMSGGTYDDEWAEPISFGHLGPSGVAMASIGPRIRVPGIGEDELRRVEEARRVCDAWRAGTGCSFGFWREVPGGATLDVVEAVAKMTGVPAILGALEAGVALEDVQWSR